jgi:hypothetical protein
MSVLDFTGVKAVNIPEGKVKKITRKTDGALLWQAVTSRIPGEYQEVEYVQAAANVGAYINLGFAFDTAATVKIGLYFGNDVATAAYPFGAAESSGKYRCMISAPHDGGAYMYGYGSTGSTYQPVRAKGTKNAVNEIEYAIKSGKISMSVKPSGSSYSNTTVSYTMSSNLYLFAQNYNGSARWGGQRRISYFQYYDKTDTLICDLVPCYRKSDGVIGLYDVVRKLFLTNVGSGSFTKGGNV